MLGTKIQDCSTLDYVPEAHTPAGTFVGINNLSGFVPAEVAAGEMGAIEPVGGRGALWKVPKHTGESFNAGDPVYYDDVLDKASQFSTTTGYLLGIAVPDDGIWTSGGSPVEVAGTSDAYVWVYTGAASAT